TAAVAARRGGEGRRQIRGVVSDLGHLAIISTSWTASTSSSGSMRRSHSCGAAVGPQGRAGGRSRSRNGCHSRRERTWTHAPLLNRLMALNQTLYQGYLLKEQ